MPYRCISGFTTGDRIIAGGALIEDDDPILATHKALFVSVGELALPVEKASTDTPRVKRSPGRPRKVKVENEIDNEDAGGDSAAPVE